MSLLRGKNLSIIQARIFKRRLSKFRDWSSCSTARLFLCFCDRMEDIIVSRLRTPIWVTTRFIGESSMLARLAPRKALSHRCKHSSPTLTQVFQDSKRVWLLPNVSITLVKGLRRSVRSSSACAVLPKTRILTSSKPCVQRYRMGTHNSTNSTSAS